MIEFRFHGRGGEGVKTLAFWLAETAIMQGLQAQAFPQYGPERSGAPVTAFVRIDDKPITIHSPVLNPDVVVVVNPQLIFHKATLQGVKQETHLIANTRLTPEEIASKNIFQGCTCCLDATSKALELLKKSLTNAAMLAAIIEFVKVLDPDIAKRVVFEKLAAKYGEQVANNNIALMDWALQNLKCVCKHEQPVWRFNTSINE